jgi:hypothetical protein
MFRTTLLAACVLLGAGASAKSISLTEVMARSVAHTIAQRHVSPMITFKVGDTDNYSLSIEGMTGTMVMSVTDVQADSLTIDQNISIAGQTQDAVEVINPNTGDIISITVNGQKQTPPAAGDDQITSETPTSITVPAGTFKCEDVKIHTTSTNSDSEQWVDVGGTVPVGGMLKMTTTAQGLPVEADLTSFSMGK